MPINRISSSYPPPRPLSISFWPAFHTRAHAHTLARALALEIVMKTIKTCITDVSTYTNITREDLTTIRMSASMCARCTPQMCACCVLSACVYVCSPCDHPCQRMYGCVGFSLYCRCRVCIFCRSSDVTLY